jgi:mono/diheme cytochrome c family protein
MRRRLPLLGLLLFAAGCDYYYNNIPSPDDLLHLVPWFDAMITSPAVHPYQRSGIPRNTVPGTVPVTGGEADWFAEWNAGNTTTADRLVNPLAGQPATARSDSVFQTFCAVCHGVAGAGDGPVGPKIAAPSLLTPRALGLTDGYFYSIIRYGGRVMPRYGDRIRGPVRWEVVNYVRQLQGAVKTPPDSATNPPRGAN